VSTNVSTRHNRQYQSSEGRKNKHRRTQKNTHT